jgi:hypothetical protein
MIMTFQTLVNRNYTTGYPGEIVRDGPVRAKPGRIASASIGTDPGASTNRISRAFGWSGDTVVAPGSTTLAGMSPQVSVGATPFYGILGQPKHYALQGTTSGGTLAPSLDLPMGYEGEFFDMVIMVAELFNETTAAKTMNYGDGVAYVPSSIIAANNPEALPFGALVSYPAGGAVPTGMIAIPNARVINPESLGASALGALVSAYTFIQLTE